MPPHLCYYKGLSLFAFMFLSTYFMILKIFIGQFYKWFIVNQSGLQSFKSSKQKTNVKSNLKKIIKKGFSNATMMLSATQKCLERKEVSLTGLSHLRTVLGARSKLWASSQNSLLSQRIITMMQSTTYSDARTEFAFGMVKI